jgi:hypothetical protein
MTSRDFRRLALGLPETSEKAHQSHPDFRVAGKIFATLGYPDSEWAMVKLTPEQQAEFVAADPAVFVPVKGGWGRKGATNVKLRPAKAASIRSALTAAWCNTAPKQLARTFEANL